MLLTLTGCTQTISDPPATEPTQTTAPLTAESPAVQEVSDAAYLDMVRETLPANTQIPNATDAQLVDAGERACAELAAGTDTSTLSVIEGEQDNGYGAYLDSGAIISAARATLCG